ncbi:carbohydrate binding domain-containing protein [Actinoplanes sp. KI2]|nr:carbohydrate binding domain-containing protein [Actinoplanes sp. KI2]MCU7730855.1 carbohydrate binding domain-containing protein [Actinoplanes sp. KI2]
MTLALAIHAGSAGAESNGGVRVMPLGDSITEGTQVPGGYRIGLWQRCTGNGYRVDFVGSQFNGPSSLGDHDHEGHPGWRIDQIDANVVGWLNTYQPHTVLLHIGTNDVLQNFNLSTAPSRLSTLIDHITNTVPTAEVFVAQITPLSNTSQDAAARTFNSAIPGIVQSKVNAGKHVHLVDMHSALTAADLTDGIHPTATGYDKMAATWFTALRSVAGSIGNPTTSSDLLANGNIEAGTSGWSIFGGGGLAANTAVVHGGANSLLRTGRTASWNGPSEDLTSKVTNGKSYTTSVWMRTQTGTPTGKVSVAITANGTTNYVVLAQGPVNSSGWTLLTGTATVSWMGTLSSARFYVETTSGTDNFYIDDASMQ